MQSHSSHRDSVWVLFQVCFQRHWYLQTVDAVDGDEAPKGEAAVFLERAHSHQPGDWVQQLAVLASHADAVPDQFFDRAGTAATVIGEHEPAVAV